MKPAAAIVVLFDQIERDEFFRRLEWPFLIQAWSGVTRWRTIGNSRIQLELAGVDDLQTVCVSRKRIRDRLFIAARDEQGALIQTGLWAYETSQGVAVCVRRVYRPDLVDVLRRRLPDFCWSTFLMAAGSPSGS